MTVPPAARFRAAIGLATLGMLALSGPLWVDVEDVPRVPFLPGLPTAPAWASWSLFALLLAATAAGIVRRGWLGLAAAAMAVLIVQDQHRFQPWAYQFLLAATAMAAAPDRTVMRLGRLFAIALYFHSGLSKLDLSFCRELGSTFLETATRPFGLQPSRWPDALHAGAVLAMPISEVAIAVGLAVRRTRRLALAGAVGLHAVLIAILGPWGLGHSPIVLVWNGAMIVEDLILFGTDEASPPEGESRPATWATAAFVLAAILPFGERWGYFDAWPSFALYASHGDRVEVSVPEDELAALPASIRRQARGEGPWRWIDLTAWSRSARGTPVYPQARACLGLAEAWAARYPGARALRAIVWGRADRWTGRRERSAPAIGLRAIRELGDRYRLNAHPAGQAARPDSGTRDAERAGGR